MHVRLVTNTPAPELLIAEAYGMCTGKAEIPTENIAKWIAAGHESPLEHASATYRIEGISRACLAQLTRHRLASYSVQSQRYTEGPYPCVVPQTIRDDPRAVDIVDEVWLTATAAYEALRELGIPREDARFVLPEATTTSLLMTANFRELRHVFALRCAPAAQWEIRAVATEMLRLVHEEAPAVFGDLAAKYLDGAA